MGSAAKLRRLLTGAAFIAIVAVLVGVPLAASANPDIDGFELDGNAAGNGANDWDSLGGPLTFTGFRPDPTDGSDIGFGSGQTKDTKDISLWTWEQADVTPAKSDIVNDYAAVYAEDGNLILYFGQNRQLDRSGDANVGFWLLQNAIGLAADGSFTGVHADGDLLIQSEFTNGGDVSGIRIYEWQGGGISLVSTNVGECAGKLSTLDACAIVNTSTISTSWAGSLTAPYFFEGGVNLTALFPQSVPCFSTFLTNTRTSQAESADLKDFGLGAIDTCASLKITKQATPSDATQFGYSTTGGLSPSTFTLTSGQSRSYTKLQPGQYSVTEGTVPAGWALDSLSCPVATGPGTSVDLNGATARITLGFVGHVECTYVNKRPPQVRVLKDLVPASDTGKFDLRIAGTVHADDVGDGGDTGFTTVTPGQVTVDELAGTGTALGNYVSSVECDSGKGSSSGTSHAFTVDYGDQVTCTITNTRKGRIVVEKQTLPNGDPQMFPFTASYDADGFQLSDNQQNDSGPLAPGAYSVAETVPAGWDLESAVCNDGSAAGAISLQAGEVVTCVFTNEKDARIVVEKQTLPNGDPQAFQFAASYDADGFQLSDGQQNDSGDLDPGTYSVAETVPAGWDLKSAVCSDGSAAGAISLQAGEVVTCVFTNEKDARIIVEKQTDPDGATQAFQFSASYDADGFQLSDGQQNDSGDLDPGTYSVSENVPANWALTSAVCSDQSPASAIELAAGETVTCVFTNTLDRGRIIVEKQTHPDGDPQAFQFSASYDADGFQLTDGQQNNSGPLLPDTYSVAENVPAGWDLLSAVCSDQSPASAISLQAGEVVTCVFTNEKDARIIVEKQTDPDGAARVFDFTASYDADGFQLSDGQQNDSGDLDPGTYSVSENVPLNWTLTSAVCSDGSPANAIQLDAGETVTCVFSNMLERGRIIVEKQTLPDGDPQAFDFTASYDADGFSLSDGQSNNSGLLLPGTYSVAENVPAGWDLESVVCDDGSPASAIALDAAEIVTCVFTNEKDARIVVEKQTNPDGDPQSFHFDASYDEDGFNLVDDGQNDSGDLDPGTYSVSEDLPAGWDLLTAVCSDESPAGAISLQAGEVVTCVFTNEKDARIVVEKQTLPNGDPQAFSFDASYDADGFSLSDGQQNDSGDLDPGTYSVSETVPVGWDLETAVCSDGSTPGDIALEAGEVVTCVFTNRKDGRIIVEKQTIPNGDSKKFTFSGSWDEGTFQLGDDEQKDSGLLDPGQYAVGEDVPLGWDLTGVDCGVEVQRDGSAVVLSLDPGQTITCVFTNTKRPPGSLNVVKTVTPTTLKEPGGTVNYTVTVENTSTVDVTINSVVDDKFGNLANVAGGNPAGCFAVPFVLAPGASSTCTFPKTLTGTAGSAHVNVVTVTGTDTSGNTLTDSDDARVDFTPRLIDLVIVKNATTPTPLNGIVTYTMTITNKGPDVATNVQVADPAPAGIVYLGVNPGAPTCTVTPSLLTCNLGTLEVGQSRTITLRARATQVGRHTNTATVTGEGGRETNPADNVDSAVTLVPQPFVPPAPAQCLTLTVTSSKMIKADGKVDRLSVRVTQGAKRVKGTKVVVRGAGVKKSARSNAKGIASLRINPRRPGVITITAVQRKNREICGPKRIGAVGVFVPPLTG
jgi:uncharacterized repeat protein (TIGR01451 family)